VEGKEGLEALRRCQYKRKREQVRGGSGQGGTSGLNRRGQDDGGVQLAEWRHGARAPGGA
jgi:hypothetical protein